MIPLMKLCGRRTFGLSNRALCNWSRARIAPIVQTGNAVEPEESPELTMVCAWCDRVLVQGTSGEISHGICDDCMPGVVREILERLEVEKQGHGPGNDDEDSDEQV
jgi:hypothetical protein